MVTIYRTAVWFLVGLCAGLAGEPAVAQSKNFHALTLFRQATYESDVQKKIAVYKEVIATDPFFVEAYFNLGVTYKQQHDYPNAELLLLKAHQISPGRSKNGLKVRILYELAYVQKSLGKLKDCEETLRNAKLVADDKEMLSQIFFRLGRLFYEQERYQDSLVELREGKKLTRVNKIYFTNLIQQAGNGLALQGLYQSARQTEAAGNLSEARALLKHLQEKNPGYKDVEARIVVLDSISKTEGARTSVMDATYEQAQRYAGEGNLEAAIALYKSILQEHGDYRDARARLETALRQLDEQRRKTMLENEYAKGIAALASQNWTSAVFALERVVELDRNYRDAAQKLVEAQTRLEQTQLKEKMENEYAAGLAALRAREWTRAIISFEKVLDRDRSYRDAGRRLAEAQRGLKGESVGVIVARYYADGEAAINRKDLGGALAAFEKVFQIDPNYRDVDSLLADIESRLRESAAPAATTKANLDSLYQIALMAAEKSDWLQAAVIFEKLQILQPNYRDVVDRLAVARTRLSQAQTAQAAPAGRMQARSLILQGAAIPVLLALSWFGLMTFSPGARARYYLFRGNYTAAVETYEGLLKRRPDRVALLSKLAAIYLQMGRRDENAMKIYRTIAQLNLATPHREAINALVAQQYLSEGRMDTDAIDVLEKALRDQRKGRSAGTKEALTQR